MAVRTRIDRFVTVGALVVLLGACASMEETLGLGKAAPDESQVRLNAPLIIPPDYALRPPRAAGQPSSVLAQTGQKKSAGLEPLSKPGTRPPKDTVERVVLPEPTTRPRLMIRGNTAGNYQTVSPELAGAAAATSQPSGANTVTQGELAFLRQTGAVAPPVNVRQIIEQEEKLLKASAESFADTVLFGAKTKVTKLDTGSGEKTEAVIEPRVVAEDEKATIRRVGSGFLF